MTNCKDYLALFKGIVLDNKICSNCPHLSTCTEESSKENLNRLYLESRGRLVTENGEITSEYYNDIIENALRNIERDKEVVDDD